MSRITKSNIAATVTGIVSEAPVFDIHTHLYDPEFESLLLWGIDDLLVYHYLVSESFRYLDISYDKFWSMNKKEQADLIWETLFIQHSPVSEACRGVLTTLKCLGIDARKRDLPAIRKWFAGWKTRDYLSKVLETANISRFCMTNNPFDDLERPVWGHKFDRDPRIAAALRIDMLLVDWPAAAKKLSAMGYKVSGTLSAQTIDGVRKFLADWTKRMDALYVMASLPSNFNFPEKDSTTALIEKAVLPHCREFGIPFSPMIGVKRLVNPQLKLAGDGVGKGRLEAVEALCARFPENKFLVTMLSRENMHELCIAARKFRNLHIFGCWWFTNVPTLIREITSLRLELIGLSVTPQHSDSRVLDQLIYKWEHSRKIIGEVLVEKYSDLLDTGWEPARQEIERDVKALFGGEFERFLEFRWKN